MVLAGVQVVENVEEHLLGGVPQQEELDAGFVENGSEILLLGAHDALRRLHVAQIVEVEGHRPALACHGVGQIADLFHLQPEIGAVGAVLGEQFLAEGVVLVEIGEVDDALVAVGHVEPEIAGIERAVMHELEIVIVLGRIDRHAVGELREDVVEHLVDLGHVETRPCVDLLDELFIRHDRIVVRQGGTGLARENRGCRNGGKQDLAAQVAKKGYSFHHICPHLPKTTRQPIGLQCGQAVALRNGLLS